MKKKLSNDQVTAVVLGTLYCMGFPYTTYGFHCLSDVIIMTMNDPDSQNTVNPEFYYDIAKRCNTDRDNVSMAIRNTMITAWTRCRSEKYSSARANLIKYGFDPMVIPKRDTFVLHMVNIIKTKINKIELELNEKDIECNV